MKEETGEARGEGEKEKQVEFVTQMPQYVIIFHYQI